MRHRVKPNAEAVSVPFGASMPGVYFTKGMSLSIPNFSITIGPGGEVQGEPVVLHLRFDVCPSWIRIAVGHLEAAKHARSIRDAAWAATEEPAKAQALEAEFEASMQAVVAAAIAWDAVYAVLRNHVDIPESLAESWRKNRIARHIQISEVVRRAFNLKPKGAKTLRETLKEIYRCRDRAVHPAGQIEAAVEHPELDVGVEWRFVFFRAANAELAVLAASSMLWDLAHNGKPSDPQVIEYQKALASRLQEIFPTGVPKIPVPSVPVG